jgi:hypothetical protein
VAARWPLQSAKASRFAKLARHYTSPYQILCEGDGDEGFLKALRAAHNLPDFEITCVAADGGFREKLESFEIPVDRGIVRKILVVADNDATPDRTFRMRQKDIRRCRVYPVPERPRQVRHSDRASMAVVMLPGDNEAGNLETLLLRAIRASHPEIVQCCEAYCECTLSGQADDWPRGRRDKMLLRSILSARIKDDPNASLAYIWNKPDNPIGIGAEEFGWVAEFIGEFFGQTHL